MSGDTFGWALLSSDSHIVEPPDLWARRIDRTYRDRAPHVVEGRHHLGPDPVLLQLGVEPDGGFDVVQSYENHGHRQLCRNGSDVG